MKDQPNGQRAEPALVPIPADKEFVDRIAGVIPLEATDRELLTSMIAAHRLMHSARSPAAEVERHLDLEVRKNLNLHRLVHNLVTQLGGEATVKDADIPFDWNIEMLPQEQARALHLKATRCPPPTTHAQPPIPS